MKITFIENIISIVDLVLLWSDGTEEYDFYKVQEDKPSKFWNDGSDQWEDLEITEKDYNKHLLELIELRYD